MENRNPWWMDDPELVGIGQRTLEELERGFDEAAPNSDDEPDPVVADFYSGEAGRALSAARDELAGSKYTVSSARGPPTRAACPA